eukprot:TRINITY_DN1222_c0_g2_i1.p1 TRINITY_DN1222_c0_g2~~TRINITY_DN1222_c0_g2_i1.p1  ORF type:complete len:986 (+),score=173.05 TRINITY_DN1222_c0_g2_i1:54-3011(+)
MFFTHKRRTFTRQIPEAAAAAIVVRSHQGAARRGVRSLFTLACALAIFSEVLPEAWVGMFPAPKQQRLVKAQRASLDDQLVSFGKHKGRTFREVCTEYRPYIHWLQNKAAKATLQPAAAALIDYFNQRTDTEGAPAAKTSSNQTRASSTQGRSTSSSSPARAARNASASSSPASSSAPSASASSSPARQARSTSAASSAAQEARTSSAQSSASPTARQARKSVQQRQEPKAGLLNADIYELPSGLLDERVVWSCPGNEWNRDDGIPGVWNMRGGWRFVSKVVLGKKLAINLEDSTLKPKDYKLCERLDGSQVSEKLSKEQYARFVGAIMEEESRVDMCKPRLIRHGSMKLEALPKFRIRGIVTDDKPHLAIVMEQEVYAGPEKHLGGQRASNKMAAASMVGLKVRPLGPAQPWFQGLVICDPKDDEPLTLTEGERKRLLSITKTAEVRKATAQAAVDELLLHVSKNCTNVKDLRMTFPANALRPSLTGAAQEEKLRKVKGWETWTSIPPARLIMSSSERQGLIDDEISRLSKKLQFSQLSRMSVVHNFHQLQAPKLVTGQGSVAGAAKPFVLMSQLKGKPAYHIEENAPGPVRLHYVVLGNASDKEKDVARCARDDVLLNLKRLGVNMADDKPEAKFLPGVTRKEVSAFFKSPEIQSSDAVLIFAASKLRDSDNFYDRAKWECLIKGRGNAHHTASQVFDLSKDAVWAIDARGYPAAVQIASVGLLAKLGHVPWALDISGWFQQGSVPAQIATPAVIGYDVCHLTGPGGDRVHVAAGIQVHSQDASSHLSKIGYRIERVPSETVPAEGIRRIVPPELARGRLVILHRDGEYPHAELKSLRDYHRELSSGKDDGTCFVLVECVKWAGKAPRIYLGSKSADAGTMIALSANDTLLASSKDLFQGTANPINARLAGILGQLPPGLNDFFWTQSVFDLSYLHHGSVFKRPRLPVTTHFADRLAYVLANAGKEWDRELETSKGGYQQFWL